MNKIFTYLFLFFCSNFAFAQNSLVINGAAFIRINNGTVASPVYMVVNEPNIFGISRIGGATGWIISEGDGNFVQWNNGATANGSYIFPFGVSTTDYIPFTFSKSAGAANMSVSTYGTINANTTWSSGVTNMGSVWGGSAIGTVIDRWWRVNATGNTADMTFSYLASENTTTASPLTLTKSQQWDAATDWLAPVGAGSLGVNVGIGTVSSGSTNSFSATKIAWVLSRSATPLPVELTRFDGQCSGKNVLLNWATASEINNNFFTIERSDDGITFQGIGTINGAGNSTSTLYYMFSDNQSFTNGAYYRLKQTDYNGDSKTSSVIFVASCTDNTNTIDVYDQGGNDCTLLINSAFSDNYNLILYSTLGQIIFSKKIPVFEGYNRFSIPFENIDPAIYFLTISNGKEKSFTKKIVISH